MKAKTYILQAGFLPIGQTDVTGWRTYSFHTGRGALTITAKPNSTMMTTTSRSFARTSRSSSGP